MSEEIKIPSAADVVLVTVTYGDRAAYLAELLSRSFIDELVGKAVVVSNDSSSDLSVLEKQWGERLQIIRLSSNTGSATGYAFGIKAGLEAGAKYLWLMDDDNVPTRGAVKLLLDELKVQQNEVGDGLVAVVGFRKDHQADLAQGVEKKFAIPPRSSFFGFHVAQVHYKILRRLPYFKTINRSVNDEKTVVIPYGPYGGLMAARCVFEKIGLPKKELVLYADDTEYTFRITDSGGRIVLVKKAVLDDLEGSWNLKSKSKNVFHGFLTGDSDFRAYYSSRNQAWFDKNCWAENKFVYVMNAVFFISLLVLFSLKYRRVSRMRLLLGAIFDGVVGRLGMFSGFSL